MLSQYVTPLPFPLLPVLVASSKCACLCLTDTLKVNGVPTGIHASRHLAGPSWRMWHGWLLVVRMLTGEPETWPPEGVGMMRCRTDAVVIVSLALAEAVMRKKLVLAPKGNRWPMHNFHVEFECLALKCQITKSYLIPPWHPLEQHPHTFWPQPSSNTRCGLENAESKAVTMIRARFHVILGAYTTFMSSGSCTPFHWFHFESHSMCITIANLVSINGPACEHKWHSHCVTSVDLGCCVCKGVEVMRPCCLHVTDC